LEEIEMIEMIQSFIMFASVSVSVTLLVLNIGESWAEENYEEECGVEF
jgi:hypothetical protein